MNNANQQIPKIQLHQLKLTAPAGGAKPNRFDKAIIAGATAGAIESVIMFPTEFVKTQLQLQNKEKPKFTGIWNCVTVTVQENGPLGLYRGLSTLVIGSIPKSAVRFTGFEVFKSFLIDKETNTLSSGRTFIAGLCAGISEALLAVTPMESVKTKFIHDQNSPPDQRKYKGFAHGVKVIAQNEGIAGFYQGVGPTIVKQATNQGTRFLVFTELQKWFKENTGDFGMVKSALSGAIAGGVSVMVNNPIDVIKTKMQGLEAKLYKNSFDCARKILVNQGPMFFYRGATPRLIRVCGDAAIAFTVYGEIVKLLDKLW
mmetsp:Transcript_16824/g.23414  ORF Transcript_16824/g.23414 Transcript_16824/m.23414 type:complete len:314 (-) Transcript_16824:41-982(-)